MFDQFLRNRLRIRCSTAGTDWQLLGANGTGYATHVALLAAGTHPAPGPPSSFPTGAPRMMGQIFTSAGAPSADDVKIATNTLIAPTVADATFTGADVLVEDAGGITSVWFKKETSGDLLDISFQF